MSEYKCMNCGRETKANEICFCMAQVRHNPDAANTGYPKRQMVFQEELKRMQNESSERIKEVTQKAANYRFLETVEYIKLDDAVEVLAKALCEGELLPFQYEPEFQIWDEVSEAEKLHYRVEARQLLRSDKTITK